MRSLLLLFHLAKRFRNLSLLTGLLLIPGLSLGQVFVQENSAGADSAKSVSATYTAAESATNLNVVVIGWSDTTSSITSVDDNNSNTYLLAGTSAGNGESQAIYYAANIGVTPNNTPTVTVTFNVPASFPDLRILEYSGLSTVAPLDNWVGNSGISALADSTSATTGTISLIVGAGTTATRFTGPGSGFSARVITAPFFDIVEDTNGALAAGSHHATAPLSNGNWVMQMAAFSIAGVTSTAPVIAAVTPITPALGPDIGGTSVTVTGTNFSPGAVVLFGTAPGGLSGLNCTESGGTTITCLTPASLTDAAVDITVVNSDGKLSSATAAYTYQPVTPTIAAITPSGPTNGSAITMTGTNFQVGAKLTIGGLPAANVVLHDSGTISANTPGLPVGPADVTVTNPDTGTVTKFGGFTYVLGTGPINYIQNGDTAPSGATATVLVPMPNVQTAGHLNVVLIGWGDTSAAVSTVTDSEGNTYVAALPATTGTGLTQVIYYAKNIKGDGVTPNQVTVTFNKAANFPDVQVLEYSGLDTTSPLDVAAGAAGSGSLADTGACTTTTPVELIVAGATVGTFTTNAGAGFTLLHITQPNGGNSEQQITSAVGSCEATAPLQSGTWVMQAAAFKAAPAPVPDFSVSSLPTTQTVVAGSPATYAISVTAVSGFNSAVTLACDPTTLPAGAACGFTPNPVTPGGSPATSTLTITTTAATPAATSSVKVTGTSGALVRNVMVSLTVTGGPDFSIVATTPAPVVQGAPAKSTITIGAVNGFTGTVALSCSGITPVVTSPPTCAFVPASVPGGSGSSVLTISTGATTPAGPYSVTVTGTTGSVSHSTQFTLTVNAPAADFTIAAAAFSPATVTAGGSATSTITIAPVNGFTGTVNLACAITPAATPAPTCSFSSSSVAGGSGTSTLTFKTTAATSASLAPWRGIFYAMWLPIGGLALLGKGSKWSRKQLLGLLLAFLMVSGLVFLAACGSGSSSGGGGGHPGTPAGAYTVTVTATSGALTHPATATVTVQ
jgi:IPT/TIG domain-containing protein